MSLHRQPSRSSVTRAPSDPQTPIIHVHSVSNTTNIPKIVRSDTPHTRSQPSQWVVDAESDLETMLRQRALIDANKRMFWSEPLLESLITPQRVSRQLISRGLVTDDLKGIVEVIAVAYRKVFAILTIINKETEIGAFLQEGVDDKALPLHQMDHISCSISHAISPQRSLSCFSHWRASKRDDFLREQHRFSPAYLDLNDDGRTIKHKVFDSHVVMPFLIDDHMQTGGYGAIAQVKIHSDCHGFKNLLNSVCISCETFHTSGLLCL
jgi:hypothetical protein